MKTVAFAFLFVVFAGCSNVPQIEPNPKKYPSLISEWTPKGLVAHFPNPLPQTATNIKLSAFPGYLQGGAWFQVRLTLPGAEVAKAYEHATKTAKEFYDGGGKYKSTNSPKHGLPGTDFYTSDNPKAEEFPQDYRIFVFTAKDAGGKPQWQNGISYGVVISKQRGEVIYYAENW